MDNVTVKSYLPGFVVTSVVLNSHSIATGQMGVSVCCRQVVTLTPIVECFHKFSRQNKHLLTLILIIIVSLRCYSIAQRYCFAEII